MLKVVKFGGTSLADAVQFAKVKSIVESDDTRKVVVVSAPGKRTPDDYKVTDLLYLCAAHLKYKVSSKDIFEMIRSRYKDIAIELKLSIDIDKEFDILWNQMQQGITENELASRGEYFSARLMADYLGYTFIDSINWVKFNFDGTINYETSYNALLQITEGNKVVIPGFYGVMPDGRVHTFTRGGSDVTGALAAAALKADVYENWTDVSGFLVADPRIIKNPEAIEAITYKELRELSYMGASVLHEDAIFPVRKEGIPINIRNTNDPEADGTLIVESTCQKPEYTITGIAGKKGFVAVGIDKDMMNAEVGFCRKALQAFEENGISIEHMPSGIDTMTVFVHQAEFEGKEQQVISSIRRLTHPDVIELEADLALIAVVGRGMKSTRGTAGRIFSALAHANINVKMIDQGSSELNIIIGVSNDDFEEAIKAIYDIFVETRL